MLYHDPNLLVVQTVKWEELTLMEQRAFLNNGYRPPTGTIIRNNLDVEYDNIRGEE